MAEVADQITVQCACGKKLRAPRSAVGRKVRCAKCGNVFTLQAPPPPVPKKREDDSLDALYELAAEEKHASKNQVDDTPRCPQCISPLPAGGVVCTNCGFNVKTGKKLQTTVATAGGGGAMGAFGTAPTEPAKKGWFGKSKSPSGKKTEDAMAPQGTFVVGLAASSAGAVIGGIIWYVIAMTTGYQVGYVALLVGILAGLGMQIGQKGYSSLGGVSAAGVSALAIILANLGIVMTIMGDDFSDSEYDDRVVEMLVEEHLRGKGLDPETSSLDEDEEAYEAVEKKLKKTSEAEMKALTAKAELKEQKDLLEYYVAYDIMKRMNIDPDNANETQEMMALKQAKQRVDPMTPQQVEAEKKRLIALYPAIASNVAEHAEEASAGSEEDDSTAETATFIVIVLLVFGWQSILFLVLAMSIAYKTAAGAVSD